METNDCLDIEAARPLIEDRRYVIDEFIGAGAMACVYKVHERNTPNVYALKLLREQFRRRDRFKEIFEREALYMRDLQYPNIVRFYKFVSEEKSAYILMDFVDGKALTHFIRQARETGEPIAFDKIVRLMAQVARAINYLHTEGFIHRDIKPGNILLAGENESAFLTDLGIAGAIDEPLLDGAGTPSYMPYEQQTRGKIDNTVDVYAFAIMLYELFTGHKPFQPKAGITFDEARKEMVELHRKQPVPSISSRRRDLPDAVDAFFDRALAKNPADRYSDILDFAKDIHEALLPFLPADLRNFDNIQAQAIDRSPPPIVVRQAAEAPPTTVNNNVIYGGLIAIVAIILLVLSGIWINANSTRVNTITNTAVAPISSETVTSVAFADDVAAIGYGDSLNESVQYIAQVREGIIALPYPDTLNGFQVVVQLDDTSIADNQNYGLIFRQQSPDDYLEFTINTSDTAWELRAIENGISRTLQTDVLTVPLPASWSVSALDDAITINFDNTIITESYALVQAGSVALVLSSPQSAPFVIESLSLRLLGDDLVSVQPATINNPLQFLLDDLRTLRASGDGAAVIDCQRFNTVYQRLEQHAVIDTAPAIIEAVQRLSTVIANRCQTEADNSAVEFSFSDYLNWDDALIAIIDDINVNP
ncbi:MAG: serine/threonine-protein kinase [Phototrophicaceae bacterium]